MAAHRWIFRLLLCHLVVLLIINLAIAAPVDNGSHEITHSGDGEIEESKADSDKRDMINNENVSLDVEDEPDEDAVNKDKEEIKETSSKSQELEHEDDDDDDDEEGKPEEETINNESSSKKENAEEVESAKSSEVVVTEDSEERKKEDLSTENDLDDLEKGSHEVLPKEAEESTESLHNNGNEGTILDNKHHMLPEEHGSATDLGSDQSGHIVQDSSEKLGDAEKSKEIEETMEETEAPDSEIFKHIDDDQARSMPLSGSLLGISEEENVEDEDGIDHDNESNNDNHEGNENEETVGTAEVKSAIEKSEENEPVPVEASTGDSVGSMEHPLEKNKMDVTHEEEDDGDADNDADSNNAEHKTSETHNSAEVETVASEEKSEAESAILPVKNEDDNGASHEKNEEETDGTHEENEAAVPHENNEDETRTIHENNEDGVAESHENSEDEVGRENDEIETEDAHEKDRDGTDVTDSGKVDTSNVDDNKDETHVADDENETDAAANDEYNDEEEEEEDDDDDANDDKDGTDVVAAVADGDSTENKDDTDVTKDEENETDVADVHEDETGVANDNEDETEHVNSEHETDVTHEAIEDETAAAHENNKDDTPASNEDNEDHVSHEDDEHGSAVTSANIEGDNARSHGSKEDEEAVSHEDREKVTVVPFGLAFDGSEHDDHEEEDAASNKTDNDEIGENDKADDEDDGDKADENDEADDYDDDALPFVASFNEDEENGDSHEEKEVKLNEIDDDDDDKAVAPEEHTSATVDGDEKVDDSHEKDTDTNTNSEDTEVDVHMIPSLNNGDAANSNETDDYDYDYEAKTETSPLHESNGSDAAMFHIGAASHDNTEPNETEEEEDAHSSHVNQIEDSEEDDHNENADVKNDDDDKIADNHSIVTSTEAAASQEVTEEHKNVYVEAVGIEDAEDGDASGGNSTWKEDENEEEYEDKSDYDYHISKEDDLILGGLSEEMAVHTESSIVDEGSGHMDGSLKPNEENETHIVREPIVPRVRLQHPLLAVPPHNEESKEVSPSSTGTDDVVATTQISDVEEEHPDIATENVIESEDDVQATNIPHSHGLGASSTIDSDSVVSSSNAENDSIFATPAVMKENIRVKGSDSGDSDGSVNEPGVGSQSENPDSDSQSSMGSYIVLGCIMGVIVVLLGYSVVRSRRRNQREKQEEDFGTEMKDVEKNLIPANQYNGGIHPDPHPEDESKTKLLHDPENKDDNGECDDESEKVDSKTTENGVQDHRDNFKHQQSYDAIESQLEPLNASNNTFNPQPKEPISPQPDAQRGHDKIVPQSARDRFFDIKPHHQNDSEHMNGFNDISEVVIEKPPTGSSPATNGYVNGNSDGLVAVHSGSQEQLSNPSSPSSKVKVRETVVEGSIPKKPLYVSRDQNGVSY